MERSFELGLGHHQGGSLLILATCVPDEEICDRFHLLTILYYSTGETMVPPSCGSQEMHNLLLRKRLSISL